MKKWLFKEFKKIGLAFSTAAVIVCLYLLLLIWAFERVIVYEPSPFIVAVEIVGLVIALLYMCWIIFLRVNGRDV